MSYCNACGAANASTSKFCINCGSALAAAHQTIAPTNNDSKKFIYIGIIAVAAIASGVLLYKLLSKPSPAIPALTTTAAELPAPEVATTAEPVVSATIPGEATAAAPAPSPATTAATESNNASSTTADADNIKSSGFERQRLQQRNRTYAESEMVSQGVLDEISDKMNDYFTDDNAYNLSIMDYFAYPINNYYGQASLSYDDLYAQYSKSANKLSYHKLTPNLASSEVKKTASGYEIILQATFEWQKKETGTRGTRHQTLKFKLNNNYKITSINEVQ
jgi:hypothetical protein